VATWQERCALAERQEKEPSSRVSSIQLELSALKDQLNKEGQERSRLKKELQECQDYVIEQHDQGFSKALDQTTYLYQNPLNKGKFDTRKRFTKESS